MSRADPSRAAAQAALLIEAWFLHTESDGCTWIYHVGLAGVDGAPMDVDSQLDADHLAYAMRVKEKGWEQLESIFLLAPSHIMQAMTQWGGTGDELVTTPVA